MSLDFLQASGLISLDNDTYVDNYPKEILVFLYMYYGSIVNSRHKKESAIFV